MAALVQNLLNSVPAWTVYLVVFLLPFLEASIFLGFIIPGETALVFGGVLAANGRVNVVLVLVVGILGAFLGDTIGFEIGKRFGNPLKASRLGQAVGESRWDTAESFVRRHGAPAIFLGRFAALLRALVPGTAGMAGIHYPTFAFWNFLGGAAWAGLCVLGGWAVGDVVAKYLSGFSYVIIGVLVVALIGYAIYRHRSSGQKA
jgi:membrane-associated protein